MYFYRHSQPDVAGMWALYICVCVCGTMGLWVGLSLATNEVFLELSLGNTHRRMSVQ